MVAQHFADVLMEMSAGAIHHLMSFTVRALAMQERYSLVAACKFLVRYRSIKITL